MKANAKPSTKSGKGIYALQCAYSSPNGFPLLNLQEVQGVVLLWGKVLVFDAGRSMSRVGYMAEFAYPFELWLPRPKINRAVDLKGVYPGVKVHKGRIPKDYVAGVPA